MLDRAPDHPPDRPPDRPTNRADALLILRGLACLAVVIAHCQPPLAQLAQFSWGWIAAMPGGIAVRVFFTLSGYLMGKGFYLGRYGLTRSKLWRYMRNRSARILPLYWAAVLIPALWLAPSMFLPSADNGWVLWRYLTFTYNHTLPERFNSPLWSLSTEVQFYAIAPLLFWLFRNRLRTVHRTVGAIGAIALGGLLVRGGVTMLLLHIHGGQTETFQLDFVRYVYTFSLTNLDSFLCGFLLNPILMRSGQLNSEKPDLRGVQNLRGLTLKASGLKFIAIAGMLSLLIQCNYWKLTGNQAILHLGPTLTIITVCLFIIAFEWGRPYYGFRQNQALSIAACRRNPWRCWEIWGVLSYGIYVWHYPLTIWLLPKFGELQDLTAFGYRTIMIVALATIAAIVTNLAIERPGTVWIQTLLDRHIPSKPLK